MWVISRFVVGDIFRGIAVISGVLLLIYLSNRFVQLLDDVASGALPIDIVFTLLVLKSASNLVLVLPPALFMATLITFGRMYKENEIAALAACGAGIGRLYRALAVPVVAVVLMIAALVLLVSPWATKLALQIQAEGQMRADVSGIGAGRFREWNRGEVVFYTEEMSSDRRNLRNVFVQTRLHGERALLVAESAYLYTEPRTGDRFIILQDGHRYEGEPGRADYRVVSFHRYGVRIEEGAPDQTFVRWDARTIRELIASGAPRDYGELHWRLSVPISALLLSLLAIPLAHTTPRSGYGGKLVLAFLIYAVYANTLVVARRWVDSGAVQPWVGLWWVHGLMLVVLGLAIARRAGWLRLRRMAPA